jgi:hypothetical protein
MIQRPYFAVTFYHNVDRNAMLLPDIFCFFRKVLALAETDDGKGAMPPWEASIRPLCNCADAPPHPPLRGPFPHGGRGCATHFYWMVPQKKGHPMSTEEVPIGCSRGFPHHNHNGKIYLCSFPVSRVTTTAGDCDPGVPGAPPTQGQGAGSLGLSAPVGQREAGSEIRKSRSHQRRSQTASQ